MKGVDVGGHLPVVELEDCKAAREGRYGLAETLRKPIVENRWRGEVGGQESESSTVVGSG